MARGQQKIQSQQRNLEKKKASMKSTINQKESAAAALVFSCVVCKSQMGDPKTYRQHFDSKHPKAPVPPEIADVQA